MRDDDLKFLRLAIAVARRARERGSHPFGAVLVDAEGKLLLESENSVMADSDCTAHAEAKLMRLATAQFSPEVLAGCTLYTSNEPCPMCAGAIYWGGVRRVVYAMSQGEQIDMSGREGNPWYIDLPCRAVFDCGACPTEVTGPLLEDEARAVHEGFWR